VSIPFDVEINGQTFLEDEKAKTIRLSPDTG
jgi:hypothetical protein